MVPCVMSVCPLLVAAGGQKVCLSFREVVQPLICPGEERNQSGRGEFCGCLFISLIHQRCWGSTERVGGSKLWDWVLQEGNVQSPKSHT